MLAIEMLRYLTGLNDGRWRTSRQVGCALDSSSSNPDAIAAQARLAGAIFGAWDGEQFWFPAFQFDDEGTPRPLVGELIAALPRDRDGGIGVDAALWVAAPDLAFEGQTPAEYFLRDPKHVIRVAHARMRGSGAED